jgi:ferric-dicitrate binding protein FerR (iron transport regulator)
VDAVAGVILLQTGGGVYTLRIDGADGSISVVGASFKVLAAESIELTVEENSIQINPEGVQITGLTNKIQAEVQMQTQALAEQVQVQGEQMQEIVMHMLQG